MIMRENGACYFCLTYLYFYTMSSYHSSAIPRTRVNRPTLYKIHLFTIGRHLVEHLLFGLPVVLITLFVKPNIVVLYFSNKMSKMLTRHYRTSRNRLRIKPLVYTTLTRSQLTV